MSALREWAAALGGEAHQAVAVSSLGKWKTATQVPQSSCVMQLLAVFGARCSQRSDAVMTARYYVLTDGVTDATPGGG